jgi:hypothetical protein
VTTLQGTACNVPLHGISSSRTGRVKSIQYFEINMETGRHVHPYSKFILYISYKGVLLIAGNSYTTCETCDGRSGIVADFSSSLFAFLQLTKILSLLHTHILQASCGMRQPSPGSTLSAFKLFNLGASSLTRHVAEYRFFLRYRYGKLMVVQINRLIRS